jgi:putative FmdB family regulatory protein
MPTYEYNCNNCGKFEAYQKITDEALTQCIKCGCEVVKVPCTTAFQLIGGGWATDGYSSTNKK